MILESIPLDTTVIRVIPDDNLVDEVKKYLVRLTLTHDGRLVKKNHHFKTLFVPSNEVVFDSNRKVLYCHPSLYRDVQEVMRKIADR